MGTIAEAINGGLNSSASIITNSQSFEQTLETQDAEEGRVSIDGCSGTRISSNGTNRQFGSSREHSQHRQQLAKTSLVGQQVPALGRRSTKVGNVFKNVAEGCNMVEQSQCPHIVHSQQNFYYNPLYMGSSENDHEHLSHDNSCPRNEKASLVGHEHQSNAVISNLNHNHVTGVIDNDSEEHEVDSDDMLKDIYLYSDMANSTASEGDRVNRKLTHHHCKRTLADVTINSNRRTEPNSPNEFVESSNCIESSIGDSSFPIQQLDSSSIQTNHYIGIRRRTAGHQGPNRLPIQFVQQDWGDSVCPRRRMVRINPQEANIDESMSHGTNQDGSFQQPATLLIETNDSISDNQMEPPEDCRGLFVEYQTRNSLNGSLEELHSLNVSNVCDSETLEEQINMLSTDGCFVAGDDLNNFTLNSTNDHLLNMQSIGGDGLQHQQAMLTHRFMSDASMGQMRTQHAQNQFNSSSVSLLDSGESTPSAFVSSLDKTRPTDTNLTIEDIDSLSGARKTKRSRATRKRTITNGPRSSSKEKPDESQDLMTKVSNRKAKPNGMTEKKIPAKITTTNTNKRLLPAKRNIQQQNDESLTIRPLQSGFNWSSSPSSNTSTSNTSMSPSGSLFDYETTPYRQQLENLRKKLISGSSGSTNSDRLSRQDNSNAQGITRTNHQNASISSSSGLYVQDTQPTSSKQSTCNMSPMTTFVVTPGHEFTSNLSADTTSGMNI